MASTAALAITIKEFRDTKTINSTSFVDMCDQFVTGICGHATSVQNRQSWADCYTFLQANLPKQNTYDNFYLVFELMMPESLRRADVIVLSQKKVLVLEFKQKDEVNKSDIAQVGGYSQSIQYYHGATQEKEMQVKPYLVCTKGAPSGCYGSVEVLNASNFEQTMKTELQGEMALSKAECEEWVISAFSPLENIAKATRQLFKDGSLPNIKSIQEGDLQETLEKINEIIGDKTINKKIIFLSGVPGSGKTLVGLKTVYDHALKTPNANPIYLSGNGPLVNILQGTLSPIKVPLAGKSYVQEMKNFKQHSKNGTIPVNKIIVFDEAQRAWDIANNSGISEAALLRELGDKIANMYGEVTILCLMGDGQAIYLKEEGGLPIWEKALESRPDWQVYIPEEYKSLFAKVERLNCIPALKLDTSIRHNFIDFSPWVEAILSLNKTEANRLYREMVPKGFECWITRKKEALPKIVEWVKAEDKENHTGIVVSSYFKRENYTNYFGKQYESSYIKPDKSYEWYMRESEKLVNGASEFLIQGIELEYPIVAFMGDYYIKDGAWVIDEYVVKQAKNKGFEDFSKIIQNIYRVLLTRSRKGMFLYFSNEPKLDETFKWFKEMLEM